MLLHQHFNTPASGGALRSYYLATALIRANISVTVITGYSGKSYKVENVEGVEVHYLPVPYDNRFGFWKRILSFWRYNIGVIRLAGKLPDVSICYAISVPLTIGLPAYWLKIRYGIHYIFEVGDLWPEAPIQMGFIKNYFLKRLLYGLEKFIYKKSDAVVALSPMIKQAIERKCPGKIVHEIPNMSDTEFYVPEMKNPVLEAKFGVTGNFVVSYMGAIGLANGLDFYIECARACQQANLPVHFLLCGDGALREYFQRVVKQYALNNFTVLPFQDRAGVKMVMNITDAAFISYKPLPVLETGSPNKYFDGLSAGKLVAINFGGWIKEEIEKQECGIYVSPKQPRDFVKKIEVFLQDSQRLKRCQQASRSLAESKYSREILSNKFVSIFRG